MENLAVYMMCQIFELNCYKIEYNGYHVKKVYPSFSTIDIFDLFSKYQQKFENASNEAIYIYIVNEWKNAIIVCSKEKQSYVFSCQLHESFTKKKAHELAELLYLELYGEYKESFILIDTFELDQQVLKQDIFKHHYGNVLHHNISVEKYLLKAVQNGKTNEAIDYFEELMKEPFNASLSSQGKRHHKNMLISLVTLLTRAVIDGGLDSETAYTFSDQMIQKIEEMTTLNYLSTYEFAKQNILEFTQLLNTRKNHAFSVYTNRTIQYIQQNIYHKIRISSIAKINGITTNYLSTLFKNEVGMTISFYIQQEKIKEATYILEHTAISYSELGSLLAFTDQSHFIKVFKKATGTTPKHYRQQLKFV